MRRCALSAPSRLPSATTASPGRYRAAAFLSHPASAFGRLSLSTDATIRSASAAAAAQIVLDERSASKPGGGGFRKKEIHIILQQDLPGIGEKGEIVLVPRKSARNYIIPLKLGYYVPHMTGRPILPEGWAPKAKTSSSKIETILPASFDVTLSTSGAQASKPAGEGQSLQSAKASADLAAKLASLPALQFARPLIDERERRTFGSVSADDVVAELRNRFGVDVARGTIRIEGDSGATAGGRIKEIGEHRVVVDVGGGSMVELKVVVEKET